MLSLYILVAHLIGDHILQPKWMALGKVKNDLLCLLHAAIYTIPFVFLTLDPLKLFLIFLTHFLIDFRGWFKEVTSKALDGGDTPFVIELIRDQTAHLFVLALIFTFL